MTIEMQEPPATPTAPPRRPPWLPWVLAGVAVLILAGAAIDIVIARDDDNDNSTAVGTQQLASVQQACAQWHDTYTGSAAPPSTWCDDMVGWMDGPMNSGRMMGTMMWGSADRMRDTCQQWMATNSAVSRSQDASAWCDQMVGWMTQHAGDWDDWMMNGSMNR